MPFDVPLSGLIPFAAIATLPETTPILVNELPLGLGVLITSCLARRYKGITPGCGSRMWRTRWQLLSYLILGCNSRRRDFWFIIL